MKILKEKMEARKSPESEMDPEVENLETKKSS